MVATLLAAFSVPWAHDFLLNVPTFFLQATLKSSLIPLQHYLLQVLIILKNTVSLVIFTVMALI